MSSYLLRVRRPPLGEGEVEDEDDDGPAMAMGAGNASVGPKRRQCLVRWGMASGRKKEVPKKK